MIETDMIITFIIITFGSIVMTILEVILVLAIIAKIKKMSLQELITNPFKNLENPIAKWLKNRSDKRRKIDLRRAKIFLRKYNNIYGNQVLGNKNCFIEFIPKITNTTNDNNNILKLTNKNNGRQLIFHCYKAKVNGAIAGTTQITTKQLQDFWAKLCNNFWYDTTFEDVLKYINDAFGGLVQSVEEYHLFTSLLDINAVFEHKFQSVEENYAFETLLDINECSAAEMLSIPGMTIAKAQKAVKERGKIKKFGSLKKFLEIANVSKEYHQQIFDIKLATSNTILFLRTNQIERDI